MNTYRVWNVDTGELLGDFGADSKKEALESCFSRTGAQGRTEAELVDGCYEAPDNAVFRLDDDEDSDGTLDEYIANNETMFADTDVDMASQIRSLEVGEVLYLPIGGGWSKLARVS